MRYNAINPSNFRIIKINKDISQHLGNQVISPQSSFHESVVKDDKKLIEFESE